MKNPDSQPKRDKQNHETGSKNVEIKLQIEKHVTKTIAICIKI